MSKSKQKFIQYQCQSCGATSAKWQGKCFQCGSWDSFVEEPTQRSTKPVGYAGLKAAEVVNLQDVTAENLVRVATGWDELDRVLGGGLVSGSVSLLGGDPGVGKSTLLLQLLTTLGARERVLYVSGEESPQQVALRAKRMDLDLAHCYLYAQTDLESILTTIHAQKATVVVIDSIQTMAYAELSSASGSVSQVRECALQLTHLAKQYGVSIIMIGHMTKDGHVAGPRVLEHMVDTVLYLEGEQTGRYRLLRASKNRFGAVHELGVFAMLENGMREVKNPSLLFMSKESSPTCGSVVMACWEGSRVLLVELQTLVDESFGQSPRRVVMGIDANRLNMLLAVLSRHANIACHGRDVFVNVVGGLKIAETSADLALCLAIISSLTNKPMPRGVVIFGELGLNGEIRPVVQGQARVAQAVKHGVHVVIHPKSNKIEPVSGCRCIAVSNIAQAKAVVDEIAASQPVS